MKTASVPSFVVNWVGEPKQVSNCDALRLPATAAGMVSVATFVPVPVYSIVTVLVSSS